MPGLISNLPRIIAADFNIRMIIVKVRQYRQGYPLTKINVLAYKMSEIFHQRKTSVFLAALGFASATVSDWRQALLAIGFESEKFLSTKNQWSMGVSLKERIPPVCGG